MRLSLSALVLLVSATVHAQTPSFGLKAGLNVATISFDDDGFFEDNEGIEKRPRLGFVGGVTVDIPFTPTVGLRTEALYAQKGYVADLDVSFEETAAGGGEIDGSFTTEVDYLEVPVLLALTFPMQSGLEIGVQAGLAPAFVLNKGIGCKGFETSGGCDEVLEDTEIEGIKSFDLGGALGLTVGAGPFSVDARYSMSLTTIDENEDSSNTFFEPVDARNGVVSITGMYRFGR